MVEKAELHLWTVCGNEDLTCFPSWQDSQSKTRRFLRPGTIIFNFGKLGWPRRLCKSVGFEVAKQEIETLDFK